MSLVRKLTAFGAKKVHVAAFTPVYGTNEAGIGLLPDNTINIDDVSLPAPHDRQSIIIYSLRIVKTLGV